MESSFEMFNCASTCFPIYSCPLSEVAPFNPFSVRPNHDHDTTNAYSSYYPDHPSNLGIPARSQSPPPQFNTMELDRLHRSSSRLPSRTDRCLVCSDRASGIHFGVSTCEACKAFFRRTNLSSYAVSLPCSPIRCEINIKNRNNCPSCRFDKCKRLGMDRENVIYGKPSKQPHYHQDHYKEQLAHLSQEWIKTFRTIHSIDQTPLSAFETKQQLDSLAQMPFQLFYPQTPQLQINASDVLHRVLLILSKNNLTMDYWLIQNINLRAILSLWLFVYYYETFLIKQKISQEKLTMLVQLLEMELIKMNEYYEPDDDQRKVFRIDFMNTFTKLSDLMQDTHFDH